MAEKKGTGRRGSLAGRYREGTGVETEFEPGSRGRVLRNLEHITSPGTIAEAETLLLRHLHADLGRIFPPTHHFTDESVRVLHRRWLEGLYPWAGEYRSVDISKGGFRFAVPRVIPTLMREYSDSVLARLTPCRGFDPKQLSFALAETHVELILIHPFREGNGRVARLLADAMAGQAGWGRLNFQRLQGRRMKIYLKAIRAGLDRDYRPMSEIFSGILRDSRGTAR